MGEKQEEAESEGSRDTERSPLATLFALSHLPQGERLANSDSLFIFIFIPRPPQNALPQNLLLISELCPPFGHAFVFQCFLCCLFFSSHCACPSLMPCTSSLSISLCVLLFAFSLSTHSLQSRACSSLLSNISGSLLFSAASLYSSCLLLDLTSSFFLFFSPSNSQELKLS